MSKFSIRKPFRYVFWNSAFAIIAINVGVFLLTKADVSREILSRLALNVVNVTKFKMYWQFFTYQFCHADRLHLLFNMLGVFFFGVSVEKSLGSKEFLLLYLSAGFFCGAVSFAAYSCFGLRHVFLMGASGSIYAILFAFAVIFPQARIYMWGIVPVPSPILILIYAVVEFFGLSGANVAHIAHLAGFLYAFLYFVIRMNVNPIKIWKNYFD